MLRNWKMSRLKVWAAFWTAFSLALSGFPHHLVADSSFVGRLGFWRMYFRLRGLIVGVPIIGRREMSRQFGFLLS